jgi:hypothetical protein
MTIYERAVQVSGLHLVPLVYRRSTPRGTIEVESTGSFAAVFINPNDSPYSSVKWGRHTRPTPSQTPAQIRGEKVVDDAG